MSRRVIVKRTIATIAVAVLSIAACGGDDDSPDTTTSGGDAGTTLPGGQSQIANPASQYCIDQGGTLEIVDEAGGQVGYCNLPNGNRVEEWELFRSAGG